MYKALSDEMINLAPRASIFGISVSITQLVIFVGYFKTKRNNSQPCILPPPSRSTYEERRLYDNRCSLIRFFCVRDNSKITEIKISRKISKNCINFGKLRPVDFANRIPLTRPETSSLAAS